MGDMILVQSFPTTGSANMGLCAAPNGDIYFAQQGGDIHIRTGGVGAFVAMGEAVRGWAQMGAAPNGDIYAAEFGTGGAAYKRAGGAGAFVVIGGTAGANWITPIVVMANGDTHCQKNTNEFVKNWSVVTSPTPFGPTNNGFAVSPVDDVQWRCLGTGVYTRLLPAANFTLLVNPAMNQRGIAVGKTNNVYFGVANGANGDIWKAPGGVPPFVRLNCTGRNYTWLCLAPNGDGYAGVNSGGGNFDVYVYRGMDSSGTRRRHRGGELWGIIPEVAPYLG